MDIFKSHFNGQPPYPPTKLVDSICCLNDNIENIDYNCINEEVKRKYIDIINTVALGTRGDVCVIFFAIQIMPFCTIQKYKGLKKHVMQDNVNLNSLSDEVYVDNKKEYFCILPCVADDELLLQYLNSKNVIICSGDLDKLSSIFQMRLFNNIISLKDKLLDKEFVLYELLDTGSEGNALYAMEEEGLDRLSSFITDKNT